MLRLRPQSQALVSTLSEDELRDLPLGQGEVLTEYFCFVYFAEFKTLVLHRNRDAGGQSRLASYIESLSGQSPVDFRALITKNGLEKLFSMQSLISTEIKISIPKNLGMLERQKTAVNRMLALAEHAQAATVRIELGMGHTRRVMGAGARDLIADAVKAFGQDVQSATVRGKMSRTESDISDIVTVDLIEEALREVVELPVAVPTVSQICDGLVQAYQKRRSEIQLQATSRRAAKK